MVKGRRNSSGSPKLNQARRSGSAGARRSGGPSDRAEKRAFIPKERSLGGTQVEGRQSVKELLKARKRRTKEIWISDTVERVGIIEEILDLAFDLRVPVATVSRTKLDNAAGSESSQGIVAFAERLNEATIDDLVKTRNGIKPFLIVLDGVTDPYNLGAILRTADCAGVTGIILPEHRSVHVTPAATKSAAGAIEHLRIAMVPGVPAALKDLSNAGVWSIGLDAGAEKTIYDVTLYDQPMALVFGAEGKGLSPLASQRCDLLASIPQFGHVPSLNVSNAAALSMFEVARIRSQNL